MDLQSVPGDRRAVQRPLQQIEKLNSAQRRQIMQVLDTLLESAQLKRKNEKQAT